MGHTRHWHPLPYMIWVKPSYYAQYYAGSLTVLVYACAVYLAMSDIVYQARLSLILTFLEGDRGSSLIDYV